MTETQYWVVSQITNAEEPRMVAIFLSEQDAKDYGKSLPEKEPGGVSHGPLTFDVLSRLIVRQAIADLSLVPRSPKYMSDALPEIQRAVRPFL